MNKWIAGFLMLIFMTVSAGAAGRRADDEKLAAAMRATHVKTTGTRAIVWAPPAWPADKRAAVTASFDALIPRVEAVLGRAFDPKAYGQAHIEYFISESDAMPSHVFGAYEHSAAAGDRPYVFLSGLDSGEAPHIHETVHIVGGEFGSLLLREGVASYVQLALQPGKMRPLVKMEATDLGSLDAAVAQLLAKPVVRELAVTWLANPAKAVTFSSRPERGQFYAVSASFTKFLIERLGMEAFMKAYASPDASRAIASWQRLAEEWLAGTRSGRERAVALPPGDRFVPSPAN